MNMLVFAGLIYVQLCQCSATDYILHRDVHLDTEIIDTLEVISLGLCIKDCEKRCVCSSINFQKEFLRCRLLSSNHLQEGKKLLPSPGGSYAYINKTPSFCIECEEYESYIQLSSGNYTCIATDCPSNRPHVSNSNYELSFGPPAVIFTCKQGFTGLGSTSKSSCVPGQSWTPVDYRCKLPGCTSSTSLVGFGLEKVTMSTINPGGNGLDSYWLDSSTSWSPVAPPTISEWIQVVFSTVKFVTAVVTQGRANDDQWVTSYNIYILNNTEQVWTLHPTEFTGNIDRSTKVTNYIVPVLAAAGVRLNPQTWYRYPSLRFDILGCSP